MKYTIAAAATRIAMRKANFTNFHARMTRTTTTIAATIAMVPERTGMSDPFLLGVFRADRDALAVERDAVLHLVRIDLAPAHRALEHGVVRAKGAPRLSVSYRRQPSELVERRHAEHVARPAQHDGRVLEAVRGLRMVPDVDARDRDALAL